MVSSFSFTFRLSCSSASFFCLIARNGQACLYPLFDGKFQFPFRIIQLTLLPEQISLGLLRFGQLALALLEHILQFGNLAGFLFKLRRQRQPGLARFVSDDLRALLLQLFSDLIVEGFFCLG